jgi:uncharacterized protein
MTIDTESITLAVLMFIAALLYSSVGHAGASGYLAAMALMGLSPAVMKPTALALNILVAVIAAFKFYRVGAFSWRLFLPLAVTSVPCAYLGGLLTLPTNIYKPVIGAVLLYAAWYSFSTANKTASYQIRPVPIPLLSLSGAALGFLSGLTGVGGGIFLSPLMLFFRLAEIKTISGVAAAFILVNSIAGLTGVLSKAPALPSALPLWALVVVAGGYIGAEYGSKRFRNPTLQKLLALVLVIAGIKMIAVVWG